MRRGKGAAHNIRHVSGSPDICEPARAISKAYCGTCWGGFWDRLGSLHSGRFGDANLRTLQRRVRDWRDGIGQRLVYAVLDHPVPDLYITPELAPVEQQRKGNIPVTASGDATGRQSQWSLINWVVRLQLVILGRFKLVARTTLGNCNYPRSLGPSMEEAWPQRPLDQPLEGMPGLPVSPHQSRRRLDTLFRPPARVFSRPIPSVR